MPRIVYVLLSAGGVAGGQKMAVRHVETLVELGFDAVCYVGEGSKAPEWFDHKAPMEFAAAPRDEDIVVIPEDAKEVLETVAPTARRAVVFSQGGIHLAARGLETLARHPGRFNDVIAVSPGLASLERRLFPQARVDVVRCFADGRIFTPLAKRPFLTLVPRKRPFEAQVIRNFFRHLYPQHAEVRWTVIQDAREDQVARTMGEAALHLALPRMESVGITTLEAMAAGCICAGFVGVGGAEFATAENGFWAPEEDCVAAVDALAQAHALVKAGGAPLARMQAAGFETAKQWSYQRFRQELEATWSRLAPDARRT